MEMTRFELVTPCLQSRCSPTELHPHLVGLGRFELPTSRLSGVRSNHLSYRPRKPQIGSALTPLLPLLLRKEVIQPQVLLRLPCYDFTPITSRTLGTCLLSRSSG